MIAEGCYISAESSTLILQTEGGVVRYQNLDLILMDNIWILIQKFGKQFAKQIHQTQFWKG